MVTAVIQPQDPAPERPMSLEKVHESLATCSSTYDPAWHPHAHLVTLWVLPAHIPFPVACKLAGSLHSDDNRVAVWSVLRAAPVGAQGLQLSCAVSAESGSRRSSSPSGQRQLIAAWGAAHPSVVSPSLSYWLSLYLHPTVWPGPRPDSGLQGRAVCRPLGLWQ